MRLVVYTKKLHFENRGESCLKQLLNSHIFLILLWHVWKAILKFQICDVIDNDVITIGAPSFAGIWHWIIDINHTDKTKLTLNVFQSYTVRINEPIYTQIRRFDDVSNSKAKAYFFRLRKRGGVILTCKHATRSIKSLLRFALKLCVL